MKSIEWCGSSLRFIDQTKLPSEEVYIISTDYREIAEAIRKMKIRGAPAIGIAAAYAIALAILHCVSDNMSNLQKIFDTAYQTLASTRPTARNLFWSLERMRNVFNGISSVGEAKQRLVQEACKIHEEDIITCRMIGEYGVSLVPSPANILTHCNTGALATGGEGTALSIIAKAHREGKSIHVFVDETRPLLQGARLTMWELKYLNIDATLITDNMSAVLMKQNKIDLIIVGADRIASNGDTANKIGTYNLAVLAQYHKIPFYVAAPTSTIDSSIKSGEMIPIEERNKSEILEIAGVNIAPKNSKAYAPAFDVTPNNLITAIITENGIYKPPYNFGGCR